MSRVFSLIATTKFGLEELIKKKIDICFEIGRFSLGIGKGMIRWVAKIAPVQEKLIEAFPLLKQY